MRQPQAKAIEQELDGTVRFITTTAGADKGLGEGETVHERSALVDGML